jgi:hypothetical protein
MRTLFDISTDLEKLSELLDDCSDTEQQEAISNWLESIGSERDKKLDGYAALIGEIEARAEARVAEAKRLTELAASDKAKVRLLKERLKWFFALHNLKKVETARYKLSLAANGGKAPLVISDEILATNLPEQYQRVTVEPNTTAIREALEAGEELEFARLGERGTSLRIR